MVYFVYRCGFGASRWGLCCAKRRACNTANPCTSLATRQPFRCGEVGAVRKSTANCNSKTKHLVWSREIVNKHPHQMRRQNTCVNAVNGDTRWLAATRYPLAVATWSWCKLFGDEVIKWHLVSKPRGEDCMELYTEIHYYFMIVWFRMHYIPAFPKHLLLVLLTDEANTTRPNFFALIMFQALQMIWLAFFCAWLLCLSAHKKALGHFHFNQLFPCICQDKFPTNFWISSCGFAWNSQIRQSARSLCWVQQSQIRAPFG